MRNMLTNADPKCFRMWGWRWMDRHQRYGDSAHMPLIDLPQTEMEAVKNYTTVTLIRDPMTRFLSAFNQHFSQHKYRKKLSISELLQELTSTDIRYNPAYIHFCPQHYFIYIAKKKHVDHVLSMESPDWADELRKILIRQGFPTKALKLPALNKSNYDHSDEFSDEDLKAFYQLYKRDYELLGYEPPLDAEFVLNAGEHSKKEKPFDFSVYDEVNFMAAKFRKFWPNDG